MAQQYEVRFTELGAAFAKAKISLAAVEERARAEIAELGCGCEDNPVENLIFHTFKLAGVEFICYPKNGAIEVDTCSREELEPIKGGRFAGYKPVIPTPDSER